MKILMPFVAAILLMVAMPATAETEYETTCVVANPVAVCQTTETQSFPVCEQPGGSYVKEYVTVHLGDNSVYAGTGDAQSPACSGRSGCEDQHVFAGVAPGSVSGDNPEVYAGEYGCDGSGDCYAGGGIAGDGYLSFLPWAYPSAPCGDVL